MNGATVIIVLLLVTITALVIGKMVQAKRSGKSLHCGGDCNQCMGICAKNKQE